MTSAQTFQQYSNRVRYLTECTLKQHNINIDNRLNYNVDHIFPIKRGYQLGIPERLMASLDNLQIMDWRLNREKGSQVTEIPENIFEFMIDHEIFI